MERFPWPLQRRGSGPGQMTGAEVVTLNRYDRRRARILVRKVLRVTRANLDWAAYDANMMTEQQAPAPIRPGQARIGHRRLFGGLLCPGSIVASAADTPLRARELSRPMAFSPAVDYLARFNADLAAPLDEARAAVQSETWGSPAHPGVHLQQIVALYLHRPQGQAVQAWVKIEFEPWARLFSEMPDENGDGYPEIYARLRQGAVPALAVRRLEQDYLGRSLSADEVHRWANELASYWYPSYNTDLVKLPTERRWPLAAVEPDLRAAASGLMVQDPTVVIRGKPRGKALYLVLVIPGVPPPDGTRPAKAATSGTPEQKAVPVWVELDPAKKALQAELLRHGGWQSWKEQAEPVQQAIRAALRRRPKALQALAGKDGFLFYRRSLEYVVGGEIQAQPRGKNPLFAIVEFSGYLRRLGVDLLLVPVPTKAEVFPDKLPGVKLGRGSSELPVICPAGRRFLLELNTAGVEVMDLLPLFLAERARPQPGEEPLYQPQDTHWTDRGLRLAAAAIATRVKRYPWWSRLAGREVKYTLRPTTFKREGDLCSRLAPAERRRFRPATLAANQVLTPDGKLYDDDEKSPIVVLGDSFTGVYQRTDCGGAGVSAHLARELGHPVDLVMSYGGGPGVRQTLLTRGEQALRRMRLLIWLFAARDFHNYWDDWRLLKKGPPDAR